MADLTLEIYITGILLCGGMNQLGGGGCVSLCFAVGVKEGKN